MTFNLKDEGSRVIGISRMSGSGKTTLATELERDEEVQGPFGNKVFFLTVSQSPNIEELRASLWGFFSGYDGGFGGATVPVSIGHTQKKLVILDDVWTRESQDQLMFNNRRTTTLDDDVRRRTTTLDDDVRRRTTTLVVSRSKLADSRASYVVELLNEDEATSLICLFAFD